MARQIALTIVVCGVVLAAFGHAQAPTEPTDRQITLYGVIKEIHAYGPPGFGETPKTDSRVTYLIIQLPKAINTDCTPERPEWKDSDCAATDKIHLYFSMTADGSPSELERLAGRFKGKRVSVTGKLSRSVSVAQFTPLVLDVTAIESQP